MKIFIEKHLKEIQRAIEGLGSEFEEFAIDRPATIDELQRIEAELKQSLPEDLKDFASNVSRRITFGLGGMLIPVFGDKHVGVSRH